jgi:hypothetical protein
MAIQRSVKKTVIGPGRVRYRVLVTGYDCQQGTNDARAHYYHFLRWLADNQHLLDCGYSIAERVTIRHNGSCWQAEAEAEVNEET